MQVILGVVGLPLSPFRHTQGRCRCSHTRQAQCYSEADGDGWWEEAFVCV